MGVANDDLAGVDLDEGTQAEQPRERRGTGVVTFGSLVLLALAVVVAVILGQNAERVTVEVLSASFRAPLFVVVLVAALGLTALWELATLVLRHRRRRSRV